MSDTRKTQAMKHADAWALMREIAKAELWDEAENGSDGSGGITRDFQEGREEEAQEWIIRARAIVATKGGAA